MTIRTHVQFQYQHHNEAEGHAICFDEDLNEDPFQGTHVRCILLAGKQFTKWKHVRRVNLALGRTATQSHRSDAGLAVDGNRNTFSNTGIENNPWWQVSIHPNFVVTDIIMHNRFDMYTNRLTDYTIQILQETQPHNILFQERFRGQTPSETMHVTDIDITESAMVDGLHYFVRITLNSNNVPHMIGEVEIYGNPKAGQLVDFDVQIGDLFRTPGAQIQYIAFIQDNDADPLVGESSISNINFIEEVITSDPLPLVSRYPFL